MESLAASLFSSLEIPESAEIRERGKTLFVKKFNWDYESCLAFQKKAQDFVRKNRDAKVYIFCNHPRVFTLGRGNERGDESLVDFNPALVKALRFPVHKIHRGGGITFHYPGQWIFYPIVSIGPAYTLEDHMCRLLKSVANVLKEEFGLDHVVAAKKLMGVWKERKKLASIGVGVSRFVTEHGLALNLVRDEEMFAELSKINPCGMSHTTYDSVDSYVKSPDLLEEFHKAFVSRL